MTKELWINLPVKDVKRSKEFFTRLGFAFNTTHGDGPDSACMLVGTKGIVVMLFSEHLFKGFTQHAMTDTKQSSEVLLSFDAESRTEIDDLAKKAEASGGIVFGKPTEIQGWMYGCRFTDPDGHRWNALYMDMSKVPG